MASRLRLEFLTGSWKARRILLGLVVAIAFAAMGMAALVAANGATASTDPDDLGKKMTQATDRGESAGGAFITITNNTKHFAVRVQTRPFQRVDGMASVECDAGGTREITIAGRTPLVRKFSAPKPSSSRQRTPEGRCSTYVFAHLLSGERGKIKVQLFDRDR